MARLVLTDASPLIALARVDGLSWLQSLFGVVWMPTEVSAEEVFTRLHKSDFRISVAVIETILRRVGE